MLSTKKLLYKIVGALAFKNVTLTRTNNSYVNATDFGRLSLRRMGNLGILKFNLMMSANMPTNTAETQIGTMDAVADGDCLVTIPSQSNNATIFLHISSNSNIITIANYSGTAATQGHFFRAMIPIPLK